MNRNELWRLIQQKEKEYNRAKAKRYILTVMLYAFVFLAVEFLQGQLAGMDIAAIGDTFIGCVVISAIFVILSVPIFKQLQDCGTRENKILEDLQQQLNDMDK